MNSYKATVTLRSKGFMLGGGFQHTSHPFESKEDAIDWALQCIKTNRERDGYRDAELTYNVQPTYHKNPIRHSEIA